MFMSGSDDGTVRHYDTREPASANSIPGMRTGDVLGECVQLQPYNWATLVCLVVSSAESWKHLFRRNIRSEVEYT